MTSQTQINVIARLDANDNIGMAHGARVKQLLSMLDMPIKLHVCGVGDELSYFFSDTEQVIHLPSGLDETGEAEFLLSKAAELDADFLLCDQPRLSEISYNMFNEAGIKSIIIDDMGGAPFGDIVFNGTVLDNYHNYPNMPNSDNIYAGSEFALVNPCFAEANWQDNAYKNLLVVIGGGARANSWALWLLSDEGPLASLTDVEITMVVGASFSNEKELRSLAHEKNTLLLQAVKQERLAQLLSQHKAALTTGGMIVYEALSVGVPTLMYPQEDNLIPEALWFGENELVVDLGQEVAQSKNELLSALEGVIENSDVRQKLSNNAGKYIDGQGMKRVASLIEDFMIKENSGKISK